MLANTLVTAFELLAEYKDKIEELDASGIELSETLAALDSKSTIEIKKLSRAISDVDGVSKEATKELQGRLDKVASELRKAIGDVSSDITDRVDSVNANLYSEVRKYVAENIHEFRGKDGLDGTNGKDGADGRDGVDGKNGKDGRDGVAGRPGKDGLDGYNGRDGKDGLNGKDGKDAVLPDIDSIVSKYVAKIKVENGVDGVGIDNISSADGKLVIKLTNGKTKSIDMPTVGFNYNPAAVGAQNRKTFVAGAISNSRDAKIQGPEEGQMLMYDGTHWVNKYVSLGDTGTGAVTIGEVVETQLSQATDYILLYRADTVQKITVGNFFEAMNTTAEEFQQRAEMEGVYKVASNSKYQEFIYDGQVLTTVIVCEDDDKASKLFTKSFDYVDGVLTSYTLKAEITLKEMTRVIMYNGGNVSGINSTIV